MLCMRKEIVWICSHMMDAHLFHYCFLTRTPSLSFLVTASDATYVVVMNGSALESDRNLTDMNVGLNGIIVTNGTPCNNDVSKLRAKSVQLMLLLLC